MDLDHLRYIITGVLQAVDFMHAHNFVHRDLRESSVFLDQTGCIKVGDFSIDKRVRDLYQPSEDRFPVAIGRGGKKSDVYRLGLLVLSLALGEIVQDATVPTKSLPAELCDFLKKCLNKDEHERWSCAQLLEHKWIKFKIERSPLRAIEQDERVTSPDLGEDEPKAVPFINVGKGQSRLQNEFAYICNIGKGGFGVVMKVKNNLDGQIYAIKKIKLNPKNKSATKKLMREVKLLSRLNHENVVRYYTSWIEVSTILDDKSLDTTTSEESSDFSIKVKKSPKKKSILDNIKFKETFLNSPIQAANEKRNSDCNVSVSIWSEGEDDEDSSSDEDDDEDAFGTSFAPQSENWLFGDEDSEIVFEASNVESNQNILDDSKDSSIVFESSVTEEDNDLSPKFILNPC